MLILSARGADADNCAGGQRGLLLLCVLVELMPTTKRALGLGFTPLILVLSGRGADAITVRVPGNPSFLFPYSYFVC
jgi:hypothetical protein